MLEPIRAASFLVAAGLACSAAIGLRAEEPTALRVLREGYPRAFFFRSSESLAANSRISYESWEQCFSRLMGIEGKALDEELANRSLRNIEFFTRFKKQHPDQMVLLHYNGNARDPRYQTEKYFAGHWLYYNGTKILQDVPAAAGETEIEVENPKLFQVNMGRYRSSSEDLGLCRLDGDGKPDWRQSEQVQLLSIDLQRKSLRVRRGCYGTTPRAFQAGRSYAAAHVTEGPWGEKSHLLWYYNYSRRCPHDAQGRTCGQLHADELAARLLPGGELAAFDGLEFDVLHHELGGRSRLRGPDCDGDGRADHGLLDGVNTYGAGVIDFCRRLREKLGPKRLILADGMGARNQRAFRILNGVESEGWPHLNDWEIRDWSGGLNRHWFWNRNAYAPVLNYVNHKFVTPGAKSGVERTPEVPFSIHRLVFAAAVFTDAAVCYSLAPPKETGQLLGIWDELCKGTEKQPGWLGQPLGPAMRMAQRQPDVLGGEGDPLRAQFAQRFKGTGVEFALDGGRLKVTAADPSAKELRFRLSGVPCDGPDLLILVTASGRPMRDYPSEVARLMWVGAGEVEGSAEAARFMSFVNDEPFTSGFYFSNLKAKTVDLEWAVEGSEPIWISTVRAHHHPDAIYRQFEHGLVLANPSPRPYTFDLAGLVPGRTFRRLKGSPRQDPVTNDGSPVSGPVTLQAREGLFLVQE